MPKSLRVIGVLGALLVSLTCVRGGPMGYEKAVFAGGCFWCMTPPFEKMAGVKKVVAGYTDGKGKNPTYEDYAEKGFVEAVEVTYDPKVVTYPELLDVYWRQINPTDPSGQFVDRGPQYRAVIFFLDEEQRREAEASKAALGKSGRFEAPILTEIKKASAFYPAEDYHQDYYLKQPARYERYHEGSGRERFLRGVWARPLPTPTATPANLRKRLTAAQWRVTQEAATEPPFHNEYWDNHRDGIYVDVVSGEALFSSKDKFDSGTGWPCFTKPIGEGTLVQKADHSLGMERTEVRAQKSGSHLGHVFDDGPAPLHSRYCINSAALRFIPKEDLEKEGYGKYRVLFGK